MTLIIRADASHSFGQGHTLRCRNLCEAFAKVAPETDIVWAATPETFSLVTPIAQNFKTIVVPPAPQARQMEVVAASLSPDAAAAPMLVVDGYHMDRETLEAARQYGINGPSAQVDEKVNRVLGNHDFIFDFLPREAGEYDGLVGPKTQIKSGPDYQMVSTSYEALAAKRAEFMAGEYNSLTRKKHIVMMNGGLNIGGMLEQLIEGIIIDKDAWTKTRFSVFTLSTGENFDKVSELVRVARFHGVDMTLKADCKNIPARMVDADLFLGASGMTPYELGAIGGVASVLIDAGHNQSRIAKLVDEKDAGIHIGQLLQEQPDGTLARSPEWSSGKVESALNAAFTLAHFKKRNLYHAEKSREFCDGQGAKRAAGLLLGARVRHTV